MTNYRSGTLSAGTSRGGTVLGLGGAHPGDNRYKIHSKKERYLEDDEKAQIE